MHLAGVGVGDADALRIPSAHAVKSRTELPQKLPVQAENPHELFCSEFASGGLTLLPSKDF